MNQMGAGTEKFGSRLRRRVSRWRARLAIATLLALLMSATIACPPSDGGTPAGPGEGTERLDSEGMKVAVDEMLRTTDTLDRNRRTVELMDALTAENLPGAIEAYEKDLARVDPHESRLFANAWARIDPRGAVERMLAWRYPKITFQSVEEAVYIWAASGDAASARAYVEPSIDSSKLKGRTPNKFMVMAVLKALGVAGEYEELTSLLESLDDDGNRELFLNEVMIDMNRARGLQEVKAWIDGMSWKAKNDLKAAALKRGFEWTSSLSGEVTAEWYEEIEEHPKALELLPTAVASWGVRAPEESIPWLAKRPQSAIRDALMRQTAVGWLSRRPEEAEEWLTEQLDDPLMRDRMLLPLANRRVAQHRYADAVEIVEQVPNPAEREYAFGAVLVEWSRLDSEAAEAYIASGKVPDAAVAAMRERLASTLKTTRRRKEAAPPSQDGDQG